MYRHGEHSKASLNYRERNILGENVYTTRALHFSFPCPSKDNIAD